LAPQDLPAGFAATDAVIAAGQTQARLTITAPADAPMPLAPITLVATAAVGSAPVIHKVEAAESVMQAFSIMHTVPVKDFLVALIDPPPLRLALNPPPAAVLQAPPAGNLTVTVKAFRKEGLKGDINLAGDGLPAGVTIAPVVIPADKDEAAVVIALAKEVPVGLRQNIILTGTLKTDKETITRFAPGIPLRVAAAE
jgi:hypothetical protein